MSDRLPRAQEIMAWVRANQQKLNSCTGGHDFVATPETAHQIINKRYACTKCGGAIDSHAYYWYEEGRKSLG